jgi:DtxR family transcriptional regulator, Mn-dependent transcriptional regulator
MKTAIKSVTQGIEEYLEAIWRLTPGGAASPKQIADHLQVSPASVSGMLKRLAALALIEYRPYGKISLNSQGKRLALQLVRRHRLSERLLTDILGLPWEQAHAEACKFEHLISDQVEAHLLSRLGGVDTCPHGHPLDPGEREDSIPLSQVEAPAKLRIAAISDESPDLLQYLGERGLIPGAALILVGREPFEDGLLLVEVKQKAFSLGRKVAEKIRVIPKKEPARR